VNGDRASARECAAELCGTFVLVFGGTTAVVGAERAQTSVLLVAAFAFGLSLLAGLYAFGEVSGGHFNPAVTLAFLVTRRIAPVLAGLYLIVQLAGAVAASLVLKWALPNGAVSATKLGIPTLGQGMSSGAAVVVEAVLTFFLVWVVFATAVDPRGTFQQIAGLAIGFTVTVDVLMSYGLTGGALNPARAFGPELAGNHWSHFWIWYVGPLAGGVIAASLYELLYLRPPRPVPVGPPETGVEEPSPGDAALS
jgi:aquaporin Z